MGSVCAHLALQVVALPLQVVPLCKEVAALLGVGVERLLVVLELVLPLLPLLPEPVDLRDQLSMVSNQ